MERWVECGGGGRGKMGAGGAVGWCERGGGGKVEGMEGQGEKSLMNVEI